MKRLIEEARNEALPDRLIDSLDGFDSGCIRLLFCKTSIVIKAVQESLKNKKPNSNGIHSFTAWLPSREDFEGNSDECEDKYTDCRLFPESWVRGRWRDGKEGTKKREGKKRKESYDFSFKSNIKIGNLEIKFQQFLQLWSFILTDVKFSIFLLLYRIFQSNSSCLSFLSH